MTVKNAMGFNHVSHNCGRAGEGLGRDAGPGRGRRRPGAILPCELLTKTEFELAKRTMVAVDDPGAGDSGGRNQWKPHVHEGFHQGRESAAALHVAWVQLIDQIKNWQRRPACAEKLRNQNMTIQY